MATLKRQLNFFVREKLLLSLTIVLAILFVIIFITFFIYLSKGSHCNNLLKSRELKTYLSQTSETVFCVSPNCLRVAISIIDLARDTCHLDEKKYTRNIEAAYNSQIQELIASFSHDQNMAMSHYELARYERTKELFQRIRQHYKTNNFVQKKADIEFFRNLIEGVDLSKNSLTQVARHLKERHDIDLFFIQRLAYRNETVAVVNLDPIDFDRYSKNLDDKILRHMINDKNDQEMLRNYIVNLFLLIRSPDKYHANQKIDNQIDNYQVDDLIKYFQKYHRTFSADESGKRALLTVDELNSNFSFINFTEFASESIPKSFRGTVVYSVRNLDGFIELFNLLQKTPSVEKADIISFTLVHRICDLIHPMYYTLKTSILPTDEIQSINNDAITKLNGATLANLFSVLTKEEIADDSSKINKTINTINQRVLLAFEDFLKSIRAEIFAKSKMTEFKKKINSFQLEIFTLHNENYNNFKPCETEDSLLECFVTFKKHEYSQYDLDFGYESFGSRVATASQKKLIFSRLNFRPPVYSSNYPEFFNYLSIGFKIINQYAGLMVDKIDVKDRLVIRQCLEKELKLQRVHDQELALTMTLIIQKQIIDWSVIGERVKLPGVDYENKKIVLLWDILTNTIGCRSRIIERSFMGDCASRSHLPAPLDGDLNVESCFF